MMTYARLRLSGLQRIRSFGFNADSVHGTPLESKTRK